MILDLDAGNSRIKWRVTAVTGQAKRGVVVVSEPESAAELLCAALKQEALSDLAGIRVSSVRGDDFARQLNTVANREWQLTPVFASVSREAAGVTNAYAEPSTMGVDRWLALLAAYHHAGGNCCVLDCGSAMTFDWVDASGRHRGGFIVPGLNLMRQSLAGKTRALDIPFGDWDTPVPGTSTAEAISNGVLAMVGGFARSCREQVMTAGADCRWYITGGDAAIVSRQLAWKHELVADLVLDGLALALP